MKVGLVNRIFVFVRGLVPHIPSNVLEFTNFITNAVSRDMTIAQSRDMSMHIHQSKDFNNTICTSKSFAMNICQACDFVVEI